MNTRGAGTMWTERSEEGQEEENVGSGGYEGKEVDYESREEGNGFSGDGTELFGVSSINTPQRERRGLAIINPITLEVVEPKHSDLGGDSSDLNQDNRATFLDESYAAYLARTGQTVLHRAGSQTILRTVKEKSNSDKQRSSSASPREASKINSTQNSDTPPVLRAEAPLPNTESRPISTVPTQINQSNGGQDTIQKSTITVANPTSDPVLPSGYWTIWWDFTPPGTNWQDILPLHKLIDFYTFSDVRTTIHSTLLFPSSLPGGSNYRLFKKSIRPLWEDPVNRLGAKFIIKLQINSLQATTDGINNSGKELNEGKAKTKLDIVWMKLVEECVKGKEGLFGKWWEEVCGIVVGRQGNWGGGKVEVWVKDQDAGKHEMHELLTDFLSDIEKAKGWSLFHYPHSMKNGAESTLQQ